MEHINDEENRDYYRPRQTRQSIQSGVFDACQRRNTRLKHFFLKGNNMRAPSSFRSANASIVRRSLVLCLAFIATALGCTNAERPKTSAPVPPTIEVTGKPILEVQAQGVQIYTWKTDASGNGAWAFKAPEATFSGGGESGKHYGGPTWEAVDASKVVARKIAEAPSPDPSAIPWFLLEATRHEGNGVLSNVTFIQRINTGGGKAPAAPGANAGEEARVQYTATYIFYGAGATTRPASK
jgi:hypothetical protein